MAECTCKASQGQTHSTSCPLGKLDETPCERCSHPRHEHFGLTFYNALAFAICPTAVFKAAGKPGPVPF